MTVWRLNNFGWRSILITDAYGFSNYMPSPSVANGAEGLRRQGSSIAVCCPTSWFHGGGWSRRGTMVCCAQTWSLSLVLLPEIPREWTTDPDPGAGLWGCPPQRLFPTSFFMSPWVYEWVEKSSQMTTTFKSCHNSLICCRSCWLLQSACCRHFWTLLRFLIINRLFA